MDKPSFSYSRLLALSAAVLMTILLYAHYIQVSPSPVQASKYDEDEAQVRYILADSQLGGVIDYYRQFLDQPNIAEAVRRWDAGVRVANLYRFERVILPETGWAVVYEGTDQIIDGMDVLLTTDPLPPYDNEAQVRYILADSQLGGVIDYYRQFLDQPNIAEAVRRWDAGIRVANIYQFERVILPEIGWAVVYAGTTEVIDGMDVLLTTDPSPPFPWDNQAYFPEVWSQFDKNEAQVRYVLADSQLGGVIEYYRQFLDQPNIAEAVRRWDAGVRVANLYRFERVDLPNIGWAVVYAGTDQIIDGMDVLLTTDPIPPFDNEAQVRYILADSQLGGVIDYYRQFLDQPNVAEAVRRWDAGVRVTNIDQFERVVLPDKGWAVVYAGTDQVIDGMDVLLTTETLPPFDNEAQVRYILADSQLGGVIDYYRQFLDQPNVAEAVRRWDAGVRVSNID